MPAWLLVACAVGAALSALIAELLARHAAAFAALAVGSGALATACGLWGQVWGLLGCELVTFVLASMAVLEYRRPPAPDDAGNEPDTESEA